jgi:acetyl-CoA/propionyl-CoA carboxylase biotin carboxyl carrier protein
MQGTVIKVAATEGQQIKAGDLVLVLEAMKMEQPVNAHKAGIITNLSVEPGTSLTNGALICEIKA